MPTLNYDVAELVLHSLAKSQSATTTWGTVCQFSALALRNNANLWNPTYGTPQKLRCISHIFNKVDLFDYICAPWYNRICAREEDGLFPPTPRTQSSWSWSSDRQESFVWSPMVGSSSSGSDDEDLLEKYRNTIE